MIEKALSIFSIFRNLRGSLKIQIGNIIIVYFELVYAYLVIVTTFISFVYHPVLTAQKMKFPIRISSVIVIKSVFSWRFGYIYCRDYQWKTSFFLFIFYPFHIFRLTTPFKEKSLIY